MLKKEIEEKKEPNYSEKRSYLKSLFCKQQREGSGQVKP